MYQPVYEEGLEIFRQIVDFHNGRTRLRQEPSIDTHDAATLVNCVFWASLLEDEGRPTKCVVVYIPPLAANVAVGFDHPETFSPDNLRKLAPLLRSRSSFLGVMRAITGEIVIWGIGKFNDEVTFRVFAKKPGQVSVKTRERNVAVFYPGNAPLFLGGNDGESLVDLTASFLNDAPDEDMRFRRAAILIDLCVRMREHGHGGMIIVAPSHNNHWQQSLAMPLKTLQAGAPLAYISDQQLRALHGFGNTPERMLEAREAYRELDGKLVIELDTIAGMTSLDGAVVLDTDLKLIGFGAKIDVKGMSAPPDNIQTWEPSVPMKRNTVPFTEIGNTRHQSAARFVDHYSGCLAFVSSQDGRFTIFFKEDGLIALRANVLLD
jgi:hypothetical protein